MLEPGRGNVVLVHFPFTDLRATKLRPAVVIAIHGEDLVVAGIFSAVPPTLRETWLAIEEKDPFFSQTGLRRSSVVKGEKVATLHRSVVHSTIGVLPPKLFDAVRQLVKKALQLD